MQSEQIPVNQSVFLDLGFVTRCIAYLRTRKIHRHFFGYLCVCATAVREGRNDLLLPPFKKFFERFLVVGEAPEGTPYLVPFNESGSPDANVWLNSNVAGSYAPSSLRPQAPLLRVTNLFMQGKRGTFTLVDDHESACLESLLFGSPVNVLALAGFLFRDHAFTVTDKHEPSEADLVREFFIFFGFGDGGYSRSIFKEGEGFEAGNIWSSAV